MYETEVLSTSRFWTRNGVRRYVASEDFAILRRAIGGSVDVDEEAGELLTRARAEILILASDLLTLASLAAQPGSEKYRMPCTTEQFSDAERVRMLGSLLIGVGPQWSDYARVREVIDREIGEIAAESRMATEADYARALEALGAQDGEEAPA